MYNRYLADVTGIDSPALLVYPDIVRDNIRVAKEMIGDVNRLRPHVKTNKTAEVNQLMLDAGITKFKCATIAEAEMLGNLHAPDVLLAYQPIGPKITRLIALSKAYPATIFSCLIDNQASAVELSRAAQENNIIIRVFIDLNTGMNRTGIQPQEAAGLIKYAKELKGIQIVGLHAYDGHIRDTDLATRQMKSDAAFALVQTLKEQVNPLFDHPLTIVAGGSPTYPTHVKRSGVECSPGTFIFWDWNYKHHAPEQPFEYGAILITRVVSVIDAVTVCVDLGHKSVAAENPLPRVHFLNAPEATPVGQSEEHLVLRVPDSAQYSIGTVLYGVPVHICPTVALYERVHVIEDGKKVGEWKVIARDRFIHY
ncbi:D-TA family PLP-dependent enzyme [Asinibacterium sp. OR53]|uniref:D-TA family PLP-dependent enzyme n=1 Tax=Asinibacterium sp. OR53 TaxID=925409 RepID=UPI0004790337|nr:D-TA family PLP-dependent enzyme [Asinibacterium sp. OR53]